MIINIGNLEENFSLVDLMMSYSENCGIQINCRVNRFLDCIGNNDKLCELSLMNFTSI